MARIYPAFKRIIDFSVALTGLLVLLPMLTLIAVLIKIDSPGPITYRQKRFTKGEKQFTILKFRTMIHGARKMQFEKNILPEKLVTRTGKLLRKSHFDEFLQLINVLKGEMSLVGPRPLIVENETERLKEEPGRRERYNVRAGMAGLARIIELAPKKKEKILSRFPNTARLSEKNDAIEFDYYYANNYSFRMDASIFLETLFLSVKKLVFRA